MYVPSADERLRLVRDLLPRARSARVAEDLRGWRYAEAPMQPPLPGKLGAWEVSGHYCETARDLWLRRVRHLRRDPSAAMVEGRDLHDLVARVVLEAKCALYGCKLGEAPEALERLRAREDDAVAMCQPPSIERAKSLWRFCWAGVNHRLEETLSRYPHIGTDALVATVLPYVVDLRLDGSALGLSSELDCDAYGFGENIVFDLKFGAKAEFHRLGTTGYALAIEATFDQPVAVGCIVYVRFGEAGRITVERDYHLIGDDLRQWFVEERDARLLLIHDEIEPERASRCPFDCAFLADCWPDGADEAVVVHSRR